MIIMASRARSVAHAEFEICKEILLRISMVDLKSQMVPEEDEVANKRFMTAIENIGGYIFNMAERRKHKLPQGHIDFRDKGE